MKKILARLARWLSALAAPYPYPEPQTMSEDHSGARYAETAALLAALDEEDHGDSLEVPRYGRPQHIPEATMARLRADWGRAECVVRASAR